MATYEIWADWFQHHEEGKGLINVSTTKALAAAGDYAANDVMSESATAGTEWIFSDVVKRNGCSGEITKAQAICETTGLTPRLTLYLFTAPENLLTNTSFETGDPPDDWTMWGSDATAVQSSAHAYSGTYSVLITRNGTNCYYYQQASNPTKYRGRNVTFGGWVYATVASRARLSIYDGVSSSNSSYHTGVAGMEYLSVTRTIDGAATDVQPQCSIVNGDTSAYFDDVRLWDQDALNDNVANIALDHVNLSNYVGKIDFVAMEDIETGDSETIATPSTYGNLPLTFTCASNDLYGILVTRDAITGESAGDDMTIKLTIEQSYLGEQIDAMSTHFSRGKSDELGKAEVGQCIITVSNPGGTYTPSNTSGAYYGYLKPKRTLGIRAYDDDYNYNLFYGYIEEIIPHPHLSEQDCVITAVDGIDFLSRHDMDTALYTDTLTGAIHDYILTDAGWGTLARLDDGQDTVPFWYGSGVKARFAQEEIDDSEQGFSWIDGEGTFCFEDRHHRSTEESQTSQADINNIMAQISNPLTPRNVYNTITATVTPWDLQSEVELWRLDEAPLIPAGETRTWWGEASVSGESVFVGAWVTPASTTDYTANTESGGGGTDLTSSITVTTTKLAKTIKLQIANGASVPAYITLLKARGTYYDSLTKVTRKSEDATSQTNYQKRTLSINGKYLTNAEVAQDFVDYAIGKYKDPRAELSLTLTNQDSTTLNYILDLEISDRVTVDNDLLGIDDDYFIDHMEHNISMGGKLHTVTYRLADTINEDFWCMDFSALGTQTKLGY